MKFMSKYAHHNIVVRRGRLITTADGDRIASDVYPLRAKFRGPAGPPHMFDSVAVAQAEGWTDDERLEVERALLKGSDFGRPSGHGRGGVYLAPGQEIPPEHADIELPADLVITAAEGVKTEATMRCHVSWAVADGIALCGNEVVEGSDMCSVHLAELAQAETEPKPKRKERTTA